MANTSQTFKVSGITTHNGNSKVRFTDDMVRRVKQFSKGGATRIDLVDLPSEMTKVEALKYIQSLDMFKSAGDQAIIADSLADKEKVKREVKVKSSKETKPSIEAIKARAKKSKESSAEELMAVVGEAPL
jgi:hypothetical protein